MPDENIDNLEPELVAPELEPEPEPEPEPEKTVPLKALESERESRQRLEKELHELRVAALRMQNALQTPPPQPEPDLDPELDALVRPFIEKSIAPLKRELESYKQRETAREQDARANAAINYVQQNLPELEDVREDLVAALNAMDPDEREALTASPKAIVRLGKIIAKERSGNAEAAAKSVSRNRARSEGGATPPPTSQGKINWETASPEAIQDWMKKQGW